MAGEVGEGMSIEIGTRVTLAHDRMTPLRGTVITPPFEPTDRSGIYVAWDGKDHIAGAYTEGEIRALREGEE